MAEDAQNDDSWLYGENNDNVAKDEETDAKIEEAAQVENEPVKESTSKEQTPVDDGPPGVEAEKPPEDEKEEGEVDGETKQNGEDSDKEDLEDDDSDDDNVNVVIGDIKSTPSYTQLNIKRGTLITTTAADKNKQAQPGKFTVEEFDHVGMINGVPATEYNLDSLEDKPWRKPGADITDYFNYGFNEDTWKAYCEKQKRLRVNESGVGLQPMTAIGLPRGPIPILNDNSRRMMGPIDVIGNAAQRTGDGHKENVIQVMTADRREYSRKPPGFPDLTVPPPTSFEEFQPEYGFNPEPEPFYGGYEPTQDLQWGASGNPPTNWAPSEIKSLTPGPMPVGPPMGPPIGGIHHGSPRRGDSRERDRDRDRDREMSRSRSEKPRDRDRERSHRRERSRSRSRRHKSRSRSPSHRSHRKKKSRRHEDSD